MGVQHTRLGYSWCRDAPQNQVTSPLQWGTATQRDTEAPGLAVPAPQSNSSTLKTAAFPPSPLRLLKQPEYFRTWVQPLGCHRAAQPDYLGRGVFIGHERRRNSFPAAPPQAQALGTTGDSAGCTLLVSQCSQHTSALPKNPLSAFWELPFRAQGSSQPLIPFTSVSQPAQQYCPSDRHQPDLTGSTGGVGGGHQGKFGP